MNRFARLILLNGPPGIGKSTLARRWAANQRTAVVVEIDELRISISGWQDDDSAKLAARRMAIVVVDELLRGGNDVIVPQYLGRIDFIEKLERTAANASAAFVEIHLVADGDEVVARFNGRRAGLAGAVHPEHEVEDVRLAVAEAIGRLVAVRRKRPAVLSIAVHQDLETSLSDLTEVLDR